jgi:hypothetical protein
LIFDFPDVDRPMSPYRPLLSLFLLTLNQTFIDNNPSTLWKASRTLSLLATTLEHSADLDSAKRMAKALSPLLPMIFTYYDSIATALEDDVYILTPILLFMFKNTASRQFVLYYDMLSSDNQLRFFDFLIGLSMPAIIQKISETSEALSVLNASHEIIWRVTTFMQFLLLSSRSDEPTLQQLFRVHTHMLELPASPVDGAGPYQAVESLAVIFYSMARFVQHYVSQIFVQETGLLSLIVTSVVSIAIRTRQLARFQSSGLILWVLDREREIRPELTRCLLAIEYAVCTTYFVTGSFRPFWDFLPPELSRVAVGYDKLVKAMSTSGLYEDQVDALLRLYKEFTNFPSIRARIYFKIVAVNEANRDFMSAFVTQWKLSALICEVFRLRKQTIYGIPATGSKDFPFVVNEPDVDLGVYPSDSGYMVLQSEMLTEKAFSEALQKSMHLCQRAGLHWLIGKTTEILFSYLERQRQFDTLKELYTKVNESFVALQKSEAPRIGFARIFVRGHAAKALGFRDAIHTFAISEEAGFVEFATAYSERLTAAGINRSVQLEGEPVLHSHGEEILQICHVKCVRTELLGLSAVNFSKDVGAVEDCDWDQPMVKRFQFVARIPLPGPLSLAKVDTKKTVVSDIPKIQYYVERLGRFKEKLGETVERIKTVMPPRKAAKLFSKSVMGLTAAPIVRFMQKLQEAGGKKKQPYYALAHDVLMTKGSLDIPEPVTKLIAEIKELFVRGIEVAEILSDSQKLMPTDIAIVRVYASTWGIQAEFLKQ